MTTVPVPRKLGYTHGRTVRAVERVLDAMPERKSLIRDPDPTDPNPCGVFADGRHRWIANCGHYGSQVVGSGKHARRIARKPLVMCTCGESKVGDYLKRRAA